MSLHSELYKEVVDLNCLYRLALVYLQTAQIFEGKN